MMRFILFLLLVTALPARAELSSDLLEKAEKGDAAAQLDVATHYMAGDGVARDEMLAIDWLQKSAAGGNREALFTLGMLYSRGDIVDKDDALAFEFFLKGAEAGDPYAQYTVAGLYAAGTGVTASRAEARKWLQLAAEGGHADAQLRTGTAALQDEEYEDAYFWLGFAAAGDVYPGDAQSMRAEAAKHLTPEKIAAIDQRLKDWVARDYTALRDKAKAGDAGAQAEIAQLHLTGQGALRDVAQAEKDFTAAATAGQAEAQFQLADILAAHDRAQYKDALDWLQKAAAAGHAGAEARLGDFYAEGLGVARDDAAAAKHYRTAADKGVPHAMARLGMMYADGRGVARDLQEALFWLSLAAAHGQDTADRRSEIAELLDTAQKDAVKARLQAWQARIK